MHIHKLQVTPHTLKECRVKVILWFCTYMSLQNYVSDWLCFLKHKLETTALSPRTYRQRDAHAHGFHSKFKKSYREKNLFGHCGDCVGSLLRGWTRGKKAVKFVLLDMPTSKPHNRQKTVGYSLNSLNSLKRWKVLSWLSLPNFLPKCKIVNLSPSFWLFDRSMHAIPFRLRLD